MQTAINNQSTIGITDAEQAAQTYVANYLDPSFSIVSGCLITHEQPTWRFIIRSPYAPLGYLWVNAQTGKVISLDSSQQRILSERALIAMAESRSEIPLDQQGLVPAEYARRRANGVITELLGLQYQAVDGVLLRAPHVIWQFAIEFRLPRQNITEKTGSIDVDAQTGTPIPLPSIKIKQIMEKTDALIRHQASTTTSGGRLPSSLRLNGFGLSSSPDRVSSS